MTILKVKARFSEEFLRQVEAGRFDWEIDTDDYDIDDGDPRDPEWHEETMADMISNAVFNDPNALVITVTDE